jgi:uncharacterized membrane protein YhiD involved in acid resistance
MGEQIFLFIGSVLGMIFLLIMCVGCSKLSQKRSHLNDQSSEAANQLRREREITFRQIQQQQQQQRINQQFSNPAFSNQDLYTNRDVYTNQDAYTNRDVFTIETSSNSSKFELPPPSYESVINQQNQKSF